MKNRILCTMLALALCLGLSVPALADGPSFSDLPASHWAYGYAKKAIEAGWMAGYDNGRFGVDDKVTYDQFFTMIVRAFFPDELAAYSGPGMPWSRPYVTVAYEQGIVTPVTNQDAMMLGEWDIFYPNSQPVNRAEMASIASQTLYALGVQVDYDEAAVAASIPDHDDIYLGYEEHILTCVAAGIITGVDGKGTFNGWGSMTRGQAAVVLCQMAAVIERGGVTGPTKPAEPANPGTGLGQKLSSGATAAAGVASGIGKNDAYPTYGNSDVVSPNGYYTGATEVEIGTAQLQYEFLELVNEARVAEGHAPLTWVSSDAAEEHTLQRCYELVANYSHERPKGKFSGEVIAKGYSTIQEAFEGWMNSPGHKQTLMSDSRMYLSAAKVGTGFWSRWIICVWTNVNIENVEQFSVDNYDKSYIYD